MGKKGIFITKGTQKRQILANTELYQAFGVQVSDEGVIANKNGRKIIPAGTPVGGDDSTLQNQQAVLTVTNDAANAAKTQGVLQWDVDVTEGVDNGSLIVFGFVNENRFEEGLVIADEVKIALGGKVTFAKRN